ncbi:GNAT family N-acetyltransferase [Heyndrickxia ginsengihumi]|uniref:Alanine acetyltransferase n=1 Tax=Heyndrickxia ginsengihumi TaxID=363870 RepID=A0A0A6VEN9_9BACI|nr:GNAT family N-acetyltransferase [Heyndrickxia ginsengihumi]KHD86041.1 alanine acetyltransferase [Heyndrickxia ginsengihumi]MBE6185328.1 N-acetyltransferase [Bacillus sp. (in: firmicutes)]MCM3025137.1 GNAT family N-acetyltransferase [Heyndrickxia ginsengihumi]NEY19859.1 GNAT family N-acetyltransferase [Heyndrickxia ginsengihumi]
MLKKRELNWQECHTLYDLMVHPDVFPFVRQKASSQDEFLFLTKQTIEAEERGEIISRTILDEWENPIGVITLFDIENGAGFLGTWLGKPYHGKGYNQLAKQAFFKELFYELNIETVFMKIRTQNIRSFKAAEKLPYAVLANETHKEIFQQLNKEDYIYDLFEITKDLYSLHLMRENEQNDSCLQA